MTVRANKLCQLMDTNPQSEELSSGRIIHTSYVNEESLAFSTDYFVWKLSRIITLCQMCVSAMDLVVFRWYVMHQKMCNIRVMIESKKNSRIQIN